MFTARSGFRSLSRISNLPITQRVSIANSSLCSRTLNRNPIRINSSSFHASSSSFATYRRSTRSASNYSAFNGPPQFSPKRDPINKFRSVERRSWILKLCGVMGCAGIYYVFHLEKVESTGRWRMMDMSATQEKTLAENSFKQILQQNKGKILSTNDPLHKAVESVASRILHSAVIETQEGNIKGDAFLDSFRKGVTPSSVAPLEQQQQQPRGSKLKDYLDVNWQVFVINDPTVNAFVLPNGKIFVYTGILGVCKDQEGLATVISHEIGHVIARHSAEKLSGMNLLMGIEIALDYLVGIDFGLSQIIFKLVMELPNSRQCESEADHIGLRLMSSACFDPTKAPGVWERMQEEEKKSGMNALPEVLSTHPLSSKRMQNMTDWLPEANKIRERSNCPHPSTLSTFKFLSANPSQASPARQ